MNSVFAAECRWLARATGGMILFLVAVHLATGGLPDIAAAPPGERALFFWFGVALIGFAALWKSSLAGSVVSIIGVAGFYATELLLSGNFPGGWVLPLFFAPGVLGLLASWFEWRRPMV